MPKSLKSFIIYAQEDRGVKHELLGFLDLIAEHHNIKFWHDEEIKAGQEWETKIKEQLEDTDLFLMLISIDFFRSEYIKRVELKTAIDRHKANKSIVIPIIVRPCPWKNNLTFPDYTYNLRSLQVLPKGEKSIAEWTLRDEALTDITDGVSRLLAEKEKLEEENDRLLKEQLQLEEEERRRKNMEEEEERAWNMATGKNDQQGFNEYLKLYPEGKHRVEAKSQIDELIESRRDKIDQDSMQAELSIWEEAKSKKSLAGYNKYLKLYPAGKYAKYAGNRVAELKRLEEESQQEKYEEIELNAWNEAKALKSIASFNKYITAYPEGRYISQAKKRVGELKNLEMELRQQAVAEKAEVDFWEEIKSGKSVSSFGAYLERYPVGRFADEAKKRISNIAVPPPPPQPTLQSKVSKPGWQQAATGKSGFSGASKTGMNQTKFSLPTGKRPPKLYSYGKDIGWWLLLPVIIGLSIAAAYLGNTLTNYLLVRFNFSYLASMYTMVGTTGIYIVGFAWGLVYAIMAGISADNTIGIFRGILIPFMNLFSPMGVNNFIRTLFTAAIINIIFSRLLVCCIDYLLIRFFKVESISVLVILFFLINALAIYMSIDSDDFD